MKDQTIQGLTEILGQKEVVINIALMLFDTLKATSESTRKEMEQKLGCRYSELLRLPYYDCVRFVIIDPMHN